MEDVACHLPCCRLRVDYRIAMGSLWPVHFTLGQFRPLIPFEVSDAIVRFAERTTGPLYDRLRR